MIPQTMWGLNMKDSPMQIVCAACSAKNRVPGSKLNDRPLCGQCHQPILSIQPVVGGEQNFMRFVEHNDLPVVVDFWAVWCGPCQQFAPTFKQVAEDMYAQACFIKLDTEQNQNTAARYGIRSIPTLMIFHHGKEIARMAGALPQLQFKQWLAQNLPKVWGHSLTRLLNNASNPQFNQALLTILCLIQGRV